MKKVISALLILTLVFAMSVTQFASGFEYAEVYLNYADEKVNDNLITFYHGDVVEAWIKLKPEKQALLPEDYKVLWTCRSATIKTLYLNEIMVTPDATNPLKAQIMFQGWSKIIIEVVFTDADGNPLYDNNGSVLTAKSDIITIKKTPVNIIKVLFGDGTNSGTENGKGLLRTALKQLFIALNDFSKYFNGFNKQP